MTILEELKQVHDEYADHVDLWNYYYNSYVGSHMYRKGEYLRRYYLEHLAPYDMYRSRLENTPYDNHVKGVIDIYRSYIFKDPPKRVLASLETNPFAEMFMDDTDLDGQNIDSFMKTMADWAMVLGNVWVSVDKPAYDAETMGEELEQDIRPYATMYTPQNVRNWIYSRQPNGRIVLAYIIVVEESTEEYDILKRWTPDSCTRFVVEKNEYDGEYETIIEATEFPNALGYVPFINVAPIKSHVRGIGYSIIGDVADLSRSIYNKLSELEQNIRLSVHPTLVKTEDTPAEAGAGSVINVDRDLPGDKNPYLLQPEGASIEGILSSIANDVDAVERIAHLNAVRGTKSTMSGVALQTERQLLNSKLSDISDTIMESELKIWNLFFDWQSIEKPEDFEVEYSKSFDIRDHKNDIALFQQSMTLINTPEFDNYARTQIAKIMVEDDNDLTLIVDSIYSNPLPDVQEDDESGEQ